ncbi:cap-specific mRNA (nucleoside-2'-O-)-methyltransferase 1 isoform X2 [Tribolium madens]|uniref:cap-specific mRNA (nucleoside-2'-O-)-methyltransferase 1 isoform X2 n=1 Tax=Tribolium madens TaxID=41895 RepID=UPI001CF73FEA|nr:cap-specific mRNA (nucleoside-2'-O-)-methyltransferase 1 isoform X2 [Tribolium madens]
MQKMDPVEGGEVSVGQEWPNINTRNEDKEEESSTFVDKKILRMMKMMGYQSGFGLGKNKQGVTQPVAVEPHLSKRGLGLEIKNLEYSKEEWDFSSDKPTVVEKIDWLYSQPDLQISEDEMAKWLREDKPVNNMDEESNFCDKQTLHDVLNGKNIFDVLDLKELCQARARANPFETIRSVFFMNRASLKMANIDAATDFMFTNINEGDLGPYYFADVCAGPGGFTEYILWRKKWLFKGFGLTLRSENDFKLTESFCASPVTFLPLYGAHGDGNACCPENISDFSEKVLFETENKGVHFMMSDGGFSVEGNENMQEILSKSLYICQCLIALEILRNHGHFVTKVFDIFTCFSVGLLYLMYNCFEKVCILKPNSSRPANSERYIICCNYKGRENVASIKNYLRKIVQRLWELKNDNNLDVTEIVPLSVLKSDHNFYSYVCNSNNRIAKNQTKNLQKLAAFCRNPLLTEYRQEQLRKQCLDYWKIPDKPKVPLPRYTTEDLLDETVDNRELLLVQPREIYSIEQLHTVVDDLNDWHYALMHCKKATNICNFYAGVGLSRVYRLQCNKWVRVKNLQLVRGTLLYGELVKEKCSMENSVGKVGYKYSLHVIDALRLGDLYLTDLKFDERIKLIKVYCKAINYEFRTNSIRIRAKTIDELQSLPLNGHLNKDKIFGTYFSPLPVLGYKVNNECYEVNSILLLKTSEHQSFHSTYVLRVQIFLEEDRQKFLSLESLIEFIRQKKALL